jgi:hypothetical protein
MNNQAQIVFVKNLLASKTFWVQAVALAALVATLAGVHPQWATEAGQAELVGAITTIVTMALRLWGTSTPVSLTAPFSPPASQSLPVGVHTVTVTAPVAPPPTTITVVHNPPPVA